MNVLKLASEFTSRDKTRKSLHPVWVQGDRVFASDGHTAAVFRATPGLKRGAYLRGKPAPVPSTGILPIDHVIPKKTVPLLEVSAVDIETLRGFFRAFSKTARVLLHFGLPEDGDANRVVATLEIPGTKPRKDGSQSRPDWRLEINLPWFGAVQHEVGIEGHYLWRLIRAVEALGHTGRIELSQDRSSNKPEYRSLGVISWKASGQVRRDPSHALPALTRPALGPMTCFVGPWVRRVGSPREGPSRMVRFRIEVEVVS